MSRADRLSARLDALERTGDVRGHYVQSGMPGRRWTIWGPGWERALGTRDAEKLADGLERLARTRLTPIADTWRLP